MYLFNKITVAKILCRDAGTEGDNNRYAFTDCFFNAFKALEKLT